jgi:predicted transcriptional regulator
MKAVLISTRPEWCEKIFHEIGTDKNGKPIYEKTIEVRKTKPSIPTPFKCYIYCCKAKSQWRYSNYEGAYENSKGEIVYAQQHVIGEFICDEVEEINCLVFISKGYEIDTCLTYKEFYEYGKGKPLYGWHITDLKIYDKPKALWQFYKCDAKSFKELCDTGEICEYCQYSSHGLYLCEGRFCDETYEAYLDKNFTLTRPPQSWCYVQELEDTNDK